MAYVPVPKDLNAVKTKVMFNLTKRQILCFGGGALIGVPLFFLLKGHIGSSAAALCMMLVMLPFFLLAMYEKNGQPPEKLIRNIVQVCFLRPKQRPYRTNNFYDLLNRQDILDKEVYAIVHKQTSCWPCMKRTVSRRRSSSATSCRCASCAPSSARTGRTISTTC